ncbi:MAG TPA: SDR family NAD(P)-dependent oxidoreductase [bacterium]|nr:SDR family NAD(P)-dependent oxidoreductase [bacterium]
MKLKGKTAIVTGGAQGIGKAISKRLAADGANVAIFDLKPEGGEATAKEIGPQAIFLKTDCTKKPEVDASVAKVIEKFGQVDILVNNIGWALPTFFLEEDEAYWDKVIAVNSKTQLLVAHAVLKDMSKRKGGKIVNLSSDAGRVGQMQGVVYSLCKAGVIGFTKGLAREVARYGISVNCVCPGPTDTQLFEEAINPKIKETFIQIIPFKRIAKPEEIAAGVAFFCSPDADYVTGQVLSVSGGLTMAG